MMKKIGLLSRKKMVEEIIQRYESTSACIFIGFSKIKADAFNQLRNDLRKVNTQVLVSKNSLIKRALENKIEVSSISKFLQDTTGMVLVYDDVVKSCKVLVDFSKENEGLILKGGILENKFVSSQEIVDLAKLPPREILLGMAISGLVSPLTSFLFIMSQIIKQFLWVVEEIKKKKESEGK